MGLSSDTVVTFVVDVYILDIDYKRHCDDMCI